jgi:excisionase family DNA binding protein
MLGNLRSSINYHLPEGKIWLRAREVVAYLDLSNLSVQRIARDGQIPGRFFGHSLRIQRSDILKFENHSNGYLMDRLNK